MPPRPFPAFTPPFFFHWPCRCSHKRIRAARPCSYCCWALALPGQEYLWACIILWIWLARWQSRPSLRWWLARCLTGQHQNTDQQGGRSQLPPERGARPPHAQPTRTAGHAHSLTPWTKKPLHPGKASPAARAAAFIQGKYLENIILNLCKFVLRGIRLLFKNFFGPL